MSDNDKAGFIELKEVPKTDSDLFAEALAFEPVLTIDKMRTVLKDARMYGSAYVETDAYIALVHPEIAPYLKDMK